MGSPDPLIGALLALSTENLTNLVPHPWYSFYHYSHPTLGERIRGMKEAAA
jgi:STE24 endopeptidase